MIFLDTNQYQYPISFYQNMKDVIYKKNQCLEQASDTLQVATLQKCNFMTFYRCLLAQFGDHKLH